MKPVFPSPEPEKLFDFIQQSNRIEHEETSLADIAAVFQRTSRMPIPNIGGHIEAIGYAIQLATTEDFPARHPIQWETPSKAMTNLYWLKDIHKKIMKPIAEQSLIFSTVAPLSVKDCGPFRLHPRKMGMERKLPDPHSLEPLIQLWYKTIGEFHLSVLPKLSAPNYQTLLDIEKTAWIAHLQLQCIHPWVDGTGRSARIVENALRLRWGLPWKTIPAKDSQKYVKQIINYEDGQEWKTILKTCS